MAEKTPLTYIEGHDHQQYPVYVEKSGLFWTELDGSKIKAESLSKLQDAAVKKTRQAAIKIDLPVTLVENDKAHNISITGIHAGTGHLTIKGHPSRRTQLTGYSERVLQRLTDEEHDELARLIRQKAQATRAYDEFIYKHRFGRAGWTLKSKILELLAEARQKQEQTQ